MADIALPPGPRLATARSIRLADLAGQEWIAWQAGFICHDWLVHTLRKEGHEFQGAARALAKPKRAPRKSPQKRR